MQLGPFALGLIIQEHRSRRHAGLRCAL